MPVYVQMQHSKDFAVVTDGDRGQEKDGTLEVFDAKGNMVGRFKNVEHWFIGQARPNQE